MRSILDSIDVHVDCAHCDISFDISAAVVAESQELLEGGCPGSDYECPATLFATLVDRQALLRLGEAWRDIERSVHEAIGTVSLRAHPTLGRLLDVAQTPGEAAQVGSDVTVSLRGKKEEQTP